MHESWDAVGKVPKGREGTRPVPQPPAGKAVFLPGLLLGVLLALLQAGLLSGLSAVGFLQRPNSFVFLRCMLLLYLLMPTLFAFLVKVRTGQPATDNRAGRCVGITCAVLLFGATIVFLAYTRTHPRSGPNALGLMASTLRGGAMVFLFIASSLIPGE